MRAHPLNRHGERRGRRSAGACASGSPQCSNGPSGVDNAVIGVQIDGTQDSANTDILLDLQGTGDVVQGLYLTNGYNSSAPSGSGVEADGSGDIVRGNIIGLGPNGVAQPNGDG